MISVVLPSQLSALANIESEIQLELGTAVTFNALFDKLEQQFPALRGTFRDLASKKRRPMVRFFACGEDFSHHSFESELPAEVLKGNEPLLIVAAIAGG